MNLKEELKRLPKETEISMELENKVLASLKNVDQNFSKAKHNKRRKFTNVVPYLALIACLAILIPLGLNQFSDITEKVPSKNGDMFIVDQATIKQQLQQLNGEFPFQLPASLPFEMENVQTGQHQTNEQIISIQFHGDGGELLSLEIINSKNTYNGSNMTEQVEIGDIKGLFTENGQKVKTLIWEQNGIQYHLSSIVTTTHQGYTKDELISIAKTFE
ncbi:DUF4367 domain-containing protein [Gracilibacillus oryzae]|uniref:DUF4367 domain-containing protein n=1 Tax=Gracilibacillus oryzae TaxID=1672701 RepID=A0A7C8GS68_9BACI|nr:DUF4367 domain-containing protein [Gracilibacillus oryzae]KAB8129196.1 DUF4367 domain-containing protein [Gracilibacillus oryzae]